MCVRVSVGWGGLSSSFLPSVAPFNGARPTHVKHFVLFGIKSGLRCVFNEGGNDDATLYDDRRGGSHCAI